MAHKGGVQIATGVMQTKPQPLGQSPCEQTRASYGPQDGWEQAKMGVSTGVIMVADGMSAKSDINSGNVKKDCSNSFGS
jgi:hypothetical protein